MGNSNLTENKNIEEFFFKNKESLSREAHVTIILYKLWLESGGKSGNRFHSEDIAFAAFENWPTEYSWNLEKYSHLPSMDKLRRPLENARKDYGWMNGKKNADQSIDGYSLTEQGLKLGRKYIHLLSDEPQEKANNNINKHIINYLSRIKKNNYFKLYLKENKEAVIADITIYDVAEILETSLSNMKRFNEKFRDTKLYLTNYEDDNNDKLLMFFNLIEDLFEEIDKKWLL